MNDMPPAKQPTKAGQPFPYPPAREFVEPDWTRIPGYRGVSQDDWESATWQRKHTIKNLREFKAALGDLLPESLAASIAKDHEQRATMSMLHPAPYAQHDERGDAVGGSGAPLHGAGLRRPSHRLGQPSQGLPRQPA